jgi:L-asparagine transporter-like permease
MTIIGTLSLAIACLCVAYAGWVVLETKTKRDRSQALLFVALAFVFLSLTRFVRSEYANAFVILVCGILLCICWIVARLRAKDKD